MSLKTTLAHSIAKTIQETPAITLGNLQFLRDHLNKSDEHILSRTTVYDLLAYMDQLQAVIRLILDSPWIPTESHLHQLALKVLGEK